jgi:1,2-diacylglycerol 3-beta-galactosyltransferase
VDRCFVPTDVLNKCALERKLSPNKIIQHGLPIRKGFWAESNIGKEVAAVTERTTPSSPFNDLLKVFTKEKPPAKVIPDNSLGTKAVIQKSLNLIEGLPTVLVVGGGDGMGGIVLQAQALGAKLQQNSQARKCTYQMVVVCGKNQVAQETLSTVEWGQGIHVQVKGFVNNMDEWMKASDILVTKAGPGTIAEAAICGLPCMLSSFLPGQEEGNVPYVEDAGFGSYSGNPDEIADTVSTWLASPTLLAQMKENALKAARPNATLDIARDVAAILFKSKPA